MSFSEVLFRTIATAFAGNSFFYGSASGAALPFYTMLPSSPDPGQKLSLCNDQGDEGIGRFQFSVSNSVNAAFTEVSLEALYEIVKDIIGNISYNGEEYDVWNNVTSKPRAIGGADLNTWDAIFESSLSWEKI